jgi:hypothetical protein
MTRFTPKISALCTKYLRTNSRKSASDRVRGTDRIGGPILDSHPRQRVKLGISTFIPHPPPPQGVPTLQHFYTYFLPVACTEEGLKYVAHDSNWFWRSCCGVNDGLFLRLKSYGGFNFGFIKCYCRLISSNCETRKKLCDKNRQTSSGH